ncbi:MAG: hypothetical protein JNL32_11555 [Candidatus Kapabacteria bacterium]|nr:hypothetical protein [Candidatus Kapabacteria bacterium]
MDLYPISSNDETVILRYTATASCGEPRYVGEDIDTEIHFGKYWVPNPRDSYSIIAKGDSMIDAKIFDGDMLVIDCSREPHISNVVVAWLNGELTIKRLGAVGGKVALMPANALYSPIIIGSDDEFQILGVVTSVHRHI